MTLQLTGHKAPRNATRWRPVMHEIADVLVAQYGVPSLGNYRDVAREIVYIVLSAKTTESLYRKAYKNLWQRFNDVEGLAAARLRDIRSCVASAGLGMKRATQLRSIAQALLHDFGKTPRRKMAKLPSDEVYEYLVGLPGVGPKSALCVMVYSLDFDVFPVDSHIHRIMYRLGAIRAGKKHYHAQARLPAYVPDGRSKELHVTLIVHGRSICKARIPLCEDCCIARLCRTGIRRLRLPS